MDSSAALGSFSECFVWLTGHKPYPWQVRLFKLLREGAFPRDISLPTGMGKTYVIVVWLLALAHELLETERLSLPRRLVYVVDRRSVVDQSTKVVEEIVNKLSSAHAPIAICKIREAFSRLSPDSESLLGVSTLRGEFQDNREWSMLPFRPAIICGTVDMVGSRLLFSGYGDGAYSKAFHAGLLGNDTLIVFDECHLVPSFGQLLRNVEKAGGKIEPFVVILMSATGATNSEISLEESDLENKTIAKRLRMEKTVRIVSQTQTIDRQIAQLAADNPPRRTIIFVRSPEDVVKIATALRKKFNYVVTLTGTMRGKERDDLIENPVFAAFTLEQEPQEPYFLVATSAGEVGIDLTCTRMLTDMTSAQSLAQRFGRNVRFGEAKGEILLVCFEPRLNEEQKKALAFLKKLRGDVSGWNLWQHREELAALTPDPVTVQALPSYILDILSLTSVRNDLDVSLYLRGKDEGQRYVEIAWRKEIPLLATMADSDFESYIKRMRVLSFERLNETARRTREIADEIVRTQGDATIVVIQPDAHRLVSTLSQLQGLGDLRDSLLILPSDRGGLTGGIFSAENLDKAELDIAEMPHKQHKARERYIAPADEQVEPKRGWRVVFETEVNGTFIAVFNESEKRTTAEELLEDHSRAVAATARLFAEKMGLSREIVMAAESAGLLHDQGKQSPLWQNAIKGGSVERPLAKTSRVYVTRLNGYRHEFDSLATAQNKSELERHLVASHHAGARPTWCGDRPLSPIKRNPDEVLREIYRFSDLQKQFGWWGLAYLEAILRSADAYVSADDE